MPKFSSIFLPFLVNQTQKHKHKPISSKNTNTNPATDLSRQPNTKTTNTNPNPNISKNTNTNPELAPPTTGTSRPPSHYLSLFTTTNNLQLNRSPITQKIQNTQKKNKPKNTSIIKSQSPKISKPNQKIQPSNNPIRLPLDQNEELCVWRTQWREWNSRAGHHHHYQRVATTWWCLLSPLWKRWLPPPLSLFNFSNQNEILCVMCVFVGMGRFQKNLWVSMWVLSACCENGFTKEFWFLAWGWRWKDVWEFSKTLSLGFAKKVWIFKEKQQSARGFFLYLIFVLKYWQI